MSSCSVAIQWLINYEQLNNLLVNFNFVLYHFKQDNVYFTALEIIILLIKMITNAITFRLWKYFFCNIEIAFKMHLNYFFKCTLITFSNAFLFLFWIRAVH